MTRHKALIELIRPKQWVKNLFVFLPMFFGGHMNTAEAWIEASLAFVSFSLIASAVYCINDVQDRDSDRLHPVKRSRPVASGTVSPFAATVLSIFLVGAAECMTWFGIQDGEMAVAAIISFYFVLNLAYTFGLKKIAIVDVIIIAFGFVLRLFAGGYACDIALSPWIVLMTFLLTLFLAFAKRRDDVVLRKRENIVVRPNTQHYNLAFMNHVLGILAAVTMVCYIMYTVSPEVIERFHSDYVYVSSVFVLAALIRYFQLLIVLDKDGDPTRILWTDRFIQCCGVIWLAFFAMLIYII